MKRILSLFLVAFIIFGVSGCGGEADKKEIKKPTHTNKLTNEEIKKQFVNNGYELRFRLNDSGTNPDYEAYFKNDKNGNAFSYAEYLKNEYNDKGIMFQYNSNNCILTNTKNIMFGDMSAKQIMEKYDDELKRLKLSESDVKNVLSTELKSYLNELNKDTSKHKGYNPGTYEIGKDIPEGEYLLISQNGKGSYGLQSTSYKGSDTEIFSSAAYFNNKYVKTKTGQFLIVDNAVIYSIDDRPKLNINNDGEFKVGVDIDEGIYTVKPSNADAFYQILSDASSNGSSIIANDLGFTTPIQIKIENGQYLELISIILTKN